MGDSLHDQLLKAGLVDKRQVKQAQKQKRKQDRQQRKGQSPPADRVRAEAHQAQKDRAAQDRALNRQRQEKLQQRQKEAGIRQLIEANLLSATDGDVAYNFVHRKRVARIHVSAKTQRKLSRGEVALVTLDGGYVLVPAQIAERILQLDPDRVIVRNQAQERAVEDDAYVDYQVPDDLMW